ncbi:MAG: protein tyrosine phosphatase (PTP) superfamily phosphohydrolase (DUF442 family) [Cryomorphaceae bacterium]|jgi:protein tyrosine phosphatase (PTP) superfamily phosphohydrolase (DUF442 family)
MSLRRRSIKSIYNYLPISERTQASGQPTEHQLESIKYSGVKLVINLAPHHAENALDNRAAVVTSLGMQYKHVPVNFKYPSENKFNLFCELMERYESELIWVHCAANMRVSAFIFRYRVAILGELQEVTKKDLDKIWEPFGYWRDFIKNGFAPTKKENECLTNTYLL